MYKGLLIIFAAACAITACTTGQVYFTDESGKRVLACDVEFVGAPSVDKYAVEYALSYCARNLTKKGRRIDETHQYLLHLDLTIPLPPCGKAWDHDLAEAQYDSGQLSEKEYGYIVANIDLGLAKVASCPDVGGDD